MSFRSSLSMNPSRFWSISVKACEETSIMAMGLATSCGDGHPYLLALERGSHITVPVGPLDSSFWVEGLPA